MSKSLVLRFTPALFVLCGCVIGAENARHDMEASKAAYKSCLVAREPEACEGLRQAYEADLSAYRATPQLVIGAGSPPPLPASDGMGAGLDGPMEEGQPVINSGDCIGAVVAGVCHGMPAPGAPTATCYGQMIGDVCTGPMF
jgi:hypothetical protein